MEESKLSSSSLHSDSISIASTSSSSRLLLLLAVLGAVSSCFRPLPGLWRKLRRLRAGSHRFRSCG
eukprot:15234254-Alexandrium_andersonii.AAC.1